MPYRRLPKTDVSRLKALADAIEMSNKMDMKDLAFSSKHIHPLRNMHQSLESAKQQQKMTWDQLVQHNKTYQKKLQKTKIYITHFLQVINMCIAREELKASDRKFYDINPDETRVPILTTEEDVLKWGEIVIEGENQRKQSGGTPVMTPTIGKVKAWYEQFREAYHSQKTFQKSNRRANDKIKAFRESSDALILDVWNEVEANFSHLPDDRKREESMLYGLKYVYRSSEKKN